MYSRQVVEDWLKQQRGLAVCCTAKDNIGTCNSNSTVSATVSPRIRQIIEQQRKKHADYVLRLKRHNNNVGPGDHAD
jgi:hypothetical protein